MQGIWKLEMLFRGTNTPFEGLLPIAVLVYGTERTDASALGRKLKLTHQVLNGNILLRSLHIE